MEPASDQSHAADHVQEEQDKAYKKARENIEKSKHDNEDGTRIEEEVSNNSK